MRNFTNRQTPNHRSPVANTNVAAHIVNSKPSTRWLNVFCLSLLFFATASTRSLAAVNFQPPPTQIAAVNICVGSSNNDVFEFQATNFGVAVNLTSLTFSTTGSTYTTSDISNFHLYRNTSNNFGTASLVGTVAAVAPGAQTFSGALGSVPGGFGTVTAYFWITCDVKPGATAAHTVAIASLTTSTPAVASYAAGAGNTFTIGPPTPVTASLSASPLCVTNALTLTGTATGATSFLWAGPAGGAALTSTTTLSTGVLSVTTANAGVYTFTATNACGSTTVTTTALAVNQKPVFSTLTETPNPGCIGSSMVLSATTSTVGAGPIVYTWTSPGGTAITNPTSLTLASVNSLAAGNAGVYTISATVAGCAGTATLTSTSAMVVNQKPIFSAVTETPNPGCIGSSMALAATTSTAGAGPIAYTWTSPGGTSITNPTSLTLASVNSLAAGNAGVYTISATVAGCAGTATLTSTSAMVVNQKPVFSGVIETPNPGCIGGTMVLAATTTTAGAGPIAYTWTSPGGTAITNPTSLTLASVNSLAAGNAGVYTISATVAGCAGTATMTSTSAMVVNQPPTSVTASLSSGLLCTGASLTLHGTATGAATYSWTGPVGGAAMTSTTTVSTEVLSVTALNAGVYTLTATNTCGPTSAVTSSLTVNQLPAFTDVTETTNPACIGGSMTLAASIATAGAGPIVYSWAGPGGSDITNPNSLTTASVNPLSAADAGAYTISATVAGCAGTSTGISSVPLALNSQPSSVAPTTFPTTVCAGDAITLTGNVSDGTSLSYSWTGPSTGDISSASSVNAAIGSSIVADAGSYTLTVTAAGCAPVTGVTLPQTVNKLPSSVTASFSPTPACLGATITLSGGDSGDGSGVAYSWSGPSTGDIIGALSETAIHRFCCYQ